MSACAPSWLEGAHRYTARRGHIEHHDGTCDSMYPGTWLDRDGRCVLPEGHEGPHMFRRDAEAAPTREHVYHAERERTHRDPHRRERGARAARLAVPGD